MNQALDAYGHLSGIDAIGVQGVPASLLGAYARCDLMDRTQRANDLRREAGQLATDLNSGRWALSSAVYRSYADEVLKWFPDALSWSRQSEAFAAAAMSLSERRETLAANGRETLDIDGQNLTALWERNDRGFRALIVSKEFVETHWLAKAANAVQQREIKVSLGNNGSHSGLRHVTRSARQADLPWDVTIEAAAAPDEGGAFASRWRWLISGFVLLVGQIGRAHV